METLSLNGAIMSRTFYKKLGMLPSSGTCDYPIWLKGWGLKYLSKFIGFGGIGVATFLEKHKECLFGGGAQGAMIGKCLEKINDTKLHSKYH